jgi:hypothetical protein
VKATESRLRQSFSAGKKWRLAVLCGAGLLVALQAVAQTNLVYHRFRFFIHPGVATNLGDAEIKSRLALYLNDINLIFAKNTIRRFNFNPDADITVTDQLPNINVGDEPSETDYEIWALVRPSAATPYPQSHGGFMAFSTNGNGVATGMYWDAIHDRAALANAAPDDWDLWNYWRQIHNLVHEMGHVFGAAIGEYYSLKSVSDTTETAPLQNIAYFTGEDPYWLQHTDYWTDPMFLWTPWVRLADLTNQVRFARVTAAMINAGYRNSLPTTRYTPDLTAIKAWVRRYGTHEPVSNALVKVWRVEAYGSGISQIIFDGATSPDGNVQFAWNGAPNNADNLMVIKCYPMNAPPMVRWFSVYDAQEERMVFGHTNLNIYLDAVFTNAPPYLQIRRLSNQVVLAWPSVTTDYHLESTDNLAAPTWLPVESPTFDNGLEVTVTLPIDAPGRFFRVSTGQRGQQ